jgi:hypothetical protein
MTPDRPGNAHFHLLWCALLFLVLAIGGHHAGDAAEMVWLPLLLCFASLGAAFAVARDRGAGR